MHGTNLIVESSCWVSISLRHVKPIYLILFFCTMIMPSIISCSFFCFNGISGKQIDVFISTQQNEQSVASRCASTHCASEDTCNLKVRLPHAYRSWFFIAELSSVISDGSCCENNAKKAVCGSSSAAREECGFSMTGLGVWLCFALCFGIQHRRWTDSPFTVDEESWRSWTAGDQKVKKLKGKEKMPGADIH